MLCTAIALPYCDECDQARNDKGFREKPSTETCHNKHSPALNFIASRWTSSMMMIDITHSFFTSVSFLIHYYVYIPEAILMLTTLNLNTTSTRIFPSILAKSQKSKPNATPKTGNIWVMNHQ